MDASKNNSSAYQVDKEKFDEQYERIYGKHEAEQGEEEKGLD